MKRSSKNILEALLYKVPDIRHVYNLLDLGVITSSEHPEHSNIVSNFTKPIAIICIGLVTTCIIVQRSRKNLFHCIVIGSEVYYMKCKRGDLYKIIHDTMLAKDYIPQPMSKKIAFISSFGSDGVYGDVFTEIKTKRYVDGLFNNVVDTMDVEDKELVNYYDIVKKQLDKIEVVEAGGD